MQIIRTGLRYDYRILDDGNYSVIVDELKSDVKMVETRRAHAEIKDMIEREDEWMSNLFRDRGITES